MRSDPVTSMRPSRLPPTLVGFEYVRELVRRNSAIVLDESKDYLIEARLAPLAREAGFSSVERLILELRSQNPGKWHSKVVEALTTNETSFFRDLHPFSRLAKEVLPELLEKNRAERRLTIWSAACSTGQEPYTIAMTLLDEAPELVDWDVRIIATDLNQLVLERARAGVYKQLEVNRGLPAKHLVKYFRREGTDWRVAPELRRMCEFSSLNLVGPWPAMPPMDVVFLRNVLIYFDVPTKQQVLGRVARAMRSGGFLFLGSAETTLNLHEQFERAGEGAGGYYRSTGRIH